MAVKKGTAMLPETSILAYFAELEDPRIEKNQKHPLISIAILGVICGADSWVDIERYGNAKQEWLATFLDLKNGIPSHDTFGRVFRWLDAQQFQARFIVWTQHICELTEGQVVSQDGKKLRRSHDKRHERDGIWMVSAWAGENRMVLGQTKVAEKSNEITAILSGVERPGHQRVCGDGGCARYANGYRPTNCCSRCRLPPAGERQSGYAL